MRYLVVSDWVADYLKGKSAAVSLLDSLYPDGLAISIITFAEIYKGIYYGRDRRHYEAAFQEFVRGVKVLGITRGIARRFAVVRGEFRAQGQMVPQTDLLIAVTALQQNLTLVTRNVRDFGRVPGLRLHRIWRARLARNAKTNDAQGSPLKAQKLKAQSPKLTAQNPL
jgi:tRNA(fMet)-specific endonuclease VapC